MTPRARTEKITIRELPGETLVYDHERHKAHCLNGTAALVWRHCDGHTTVEDLAELLRQKLHIPEADAVARLALEQLSRRHLLEEAQAPVPAAERQSRRAALKTLAVASAALPLVISLTAPQARASVSGCMGKANTTPCTSGAIVGTCCGGTCISPVFQACCSGIPCDVGVTQCCGGVCPPRGGSCCNGKICGAGQICCGNTCCPAGQTCCGSTCTAAGIVCCGGTVCAPGQSCVNGQCVGNCIAAGQPCTMGGPPCCPGLICGPFGPGGTNICSI
jgi:hypothetical protein